VYNYIKTYIMKNNIGITVASIGILLSMAGTTIFENNVILQYSALVLGILLAVFGAFKADKERKLSRKSN